MLDVQNLIIFVYVFVKYRGVMYWVIFVKVFGKGDFFYCIIEFGVDLWGLILKKVGQWFFDNWFDNEFDWFIDILCFVKFGDDQEVV